jgi:hypothetical protein
MKYSDSGKPICESTSKTKREALVVLRRAETKVADRQQEGSAVKHTRFEDIIEGLKNDYILSGARSGTFASSILPTGERDYNTQTSSLRGQTIRRGSSPGH